MHSRRALEKYILNPGAENWQSCLEAGFRGDSDDYEEWKLYPFVLERLREGSACETIVQHLEHRCKRITSFNERSIPHYCEALTLLNEAEIPYVLIKGAALIALGLTDASRRVLSDVDVLIPYQQLEKARDVLSRSQYWTLDPEYKDVNPYIEREVHYINGECAVFDLHWQAFSFFYSEKLSDAMFRTRTKCLLWNVPVYVPAKEYLFFNVMIHGFLSRQGIVWILDARSILEELALDWDTVCRIVSDYQLNQVSIAADRASEGLLPREHVEILKQKPYSPVELLEYLVGEEVPYSLYKRVLHSVARSIRVSFDARLWCLPYTYLRYLYNLWRCDSKWDFFLRLYSKVFRFKDVETERGT